MDKVNKATEAVLNNLTASSNDLPKKQLKEAKPLNDLLVLNIFKKFQAVYLNKWTSALGGIEEIAMKEWGQILAGLEPEHIERGLNDLPKSWPPTVFEFKELCVGSYEERRLDVSHRENRVSHMIESDEVKENRKAAGAKFAEDAKKILRK